MANVRIKDLARTVTEPKLAEFVETDHATDGTGKLDLATWLAAKRNAFAVRGALAFDGTANTRVYAPLTNQNIGTDPCSIYAVFKVPSSNPSTDMGVAGFSDNAAAGYPTDSGMSLFVGVSGELCVSIVNASNYRTYRLPGLVSNFGGKIVHAVLVRNASGNPSVYINCVAQTLPSEATGGSPASWAAFNLPTTYFRIGFLGPSSVANFPIYSATPYNFALSQSEVVETYENGGAPLERFKTGSQVNLNTIANNTTFGSGIGNWGTGSGSPTISWDSGNQRLSIVGTGAAYLHQLGGLQVFNYKQGSAWRVKLDVATLAGGTVGVAMQFGGATVGNFATFSSVGAGQSVDIILPPDNAAYVNSGGIQISAGSGVSVTVDNVLVTRLGAICHYDADLDGIGYQLHDQLANQLDAVLTAFGVTWTKPARRGYLRGTLTWAGTHEGKTIFPQPNFPVNVILERVTTKSTAASSGSGMTIGTQASAQKWVTPATFTTAKKIQTLAAQIPSGTANSDLDFVLDPDTAAFTGSITVEAQYSVTEGNP
jgi:hypothetical protein